MTSNTGTPCRATLSRPDPCSNSDQTTSAQWPLAPVCFLPAGSLRVTTQTRIPASALSTGLNPGQRQDIADLLPFLACGEESAAHVFGHSLQSAVPASFWPTLSQIAQDEHRHAELLSGLRDELPRPNAGISLTRLIVFFKRLETPDPAEHLARVAALDLAVCRLLQPLLRHGAAISRAPALHAALSQLRADEAGHVRLARRLAGELGYESENQGQLNRTLSDRLNSLLAPVAPALARLGAVA
ncbi:hypothetical protein [Rhodoferax sp. PAMC 29310]|uniref:hypothetical protein n=1 Tax=Rhodoferax sp. PAMC 29310 TaxID=2822760 RepID=UPI001B32FFD7|nr:hypothetical protein [Rhodoferax sp. PAMC 29310]